MSEAAYFTPVRVRRLNLWSALSKLMTVAAVLLALLVSNLALSAFGISYDVEGGSPLGKIHPATYLACAAFGAFLCAPGNPFIAVDEIVRHHRGIILFLFAWLYLLVHISIVLKGPFTNIIDTFLLPPLLVILLYRLDERTLHRLAVCLHIIFAVNALLGTFELLSGWRMTPLIVSGAVLSSDYRPSAIFGHPLANAAAIGCYVLSFVLGGYRDLSPFYRAPAFLLQLLALAVFGGRAASVLVIPFAGSILVWELLRVIREKRISLLAAAAVSVGIPILLMTIAVIYSAGFFDQFIERFFDDDGSAKTRYEMFVLLSELPLPDLIFGPDGELLSTLQNQLGLEYGIESFWVSMVAHYGLMSAAFFSIGLACMCASIAHAARANSALLVFYFVLVASTSESIAAKTLSFALAVILALVMLRRPASAR